MLLTPGSEHFYDSLPTKHVAAGCVFLDEAARILLVKPTYKPPWELPGGGVEAGESPLAACRREVREELGVDWPPLKLLGVDYRPAIEGLRGDALRFVFFGGTVTSHQTDEIRLPAEELSEWRFVDPHSLDGFVTAGMASRFRSPLGGEGPYLERGVHLFERRSR